MKVLISIVSREEARLALKGYPHILDIKNPDEGSLGAQFPWIIKDIVEEAKNAKILCSATIGDLPYKPGTAALAAYGATLCGVDYIKAGLYGARDYEEAYKMMTNIVRSVKSINEKALIVAGGYADYRRFGGVHFMDLVRAAHKSGANVAMVDTAIKDGKNLFDAMNQSQLKDFISSTHDFGMQAALAGSIRKENLEDISKLEPDIVGIRGDVCDGSNRLKQINPYRVKEVVDVANSLIHTVSLFQQ
jgi:uncharacterized protein (UPF0264 family)